MPQVVALVLYPGARLFDVGIALEVLGPSADGRSGPAGARPDVELRVCAGGPRVQRLSPGVSIRATHALTGLAGADLVVVPGTDTPAADRSPGLLDAIREAHAAGSDLASLCAGAFVLAEAGLLDGRRATTHWALADELASRHPLVDVDAEALFVRDGSIWTSAGTAAGIDLCLELVRHAHGAGAAVTAARRMVAAPHRAGGQAQFIVQPVPPAPVDDIALTLEWARTHLDQPLAVADLARVARLSPRTFLRRFAAATGSTPLRWLTHARVLAAQELLEHGGFSVEQVARRTGLGSTEVLRTHFRREVGTTPSAYATAFSAGPRRADAHDRRARRQDGAIHPSIRGDQP